MAAFGAQQDIFMANPIAHIELDRIRRVWLNDPNTYTKKGVQSTDSPNSDMTLSPLSGVSRRSSTSFGDLSDSFPIWSPPKEEVATLRVPLTAGRFPASLVESHQGPAPVGRIVGGGPQKVDTTNLKAFTPPHLGKDAHPMGAMTNGQLQGSPAEGRGRLEAMIAAALSGDLPPTQVVVGPPGLSQAEDTAIAKEGWPGDFSEQHRMVLSPWDAMCAPVGGAQLVVPGQLKPRPVKNEAAGYPMKAVTQQHSKGSFSDLSTTGSQENQPEALASRQKHPPQQQRGFQKTEICRFNAVGRCRNGAKCSFAHGQAELRAHPDLKKTSLCQQWARGKCKMASKDCPYAHGKCELRKFQAQLS
jgi:hypothetical protein